MTSASVEMSKHWFHFLFSAFQPVGRAFALVQPANDRTAVNPEPVKSREEQVEVIKVGEKKKKTPPDASCMCEPGGPPPPPPPHSQPLPGWITYERLARGYSLTLVFCRFIWRPVNKSSTNTSRVWRCCQMRCHRYRRSVYHTYIFLLFNPS